MPGPLAPWGIDEQAERVYRSALRHPGATVEQMAQVLGLHPAAVRRATQPLIAARLLREAVDGLIPTPPTAAIEGLVDRERERLEQRLRHLDQARAAISDFAADHLAGQSAAWDNEPLQVVDAEEVRPVLADLLRSTTGPLRASHNLLAVGAAADPELHRVTQRQLGEGRAMSAVYPSSVLEDEIGLANVRYWANCGARSRIAPTVPAPFVAFGSEAVVVATDDSVPSARHLVVRTPVLVAIFIALFERIWDRASSPPRPTGEPRADEERSQLLELLAVGAKDERVARLLGCSVRTVRRRIAELMEDLGASTRFQAGMEAVRRKHI